MARITLRQGIRVVHDAGQQGQLTPDPAAGPVLGVLADEASSSRSELRKFKLAPRILPLVVMLEHVRLPLRLRS
jgi:hypothetical protein